MANTRKRRRHNRNVENKLVRVLQVQLKHSVVLDALCNLAGLDTVKAEVERIMKDAQQRSDSSIDGAGNGGAAQTGSDPIGPSELQAEPKQKSQEGTEAPDQVAQDSSV